MDWVLTRWRRRWSVRAVVAAVVSAIVALVGDAPESFDDDPSCIEKS